MTIADTPIPSGRLLRMYELSGDFRTCYFLDEFSSTEPNIEHDSDFGVSVEQEHSWFANEVIKNLD